MPPRQPDYRDGRPHDAFVMNLPLSAAALREALISGWQVKGTLDDWPRELTAKLAADRYSQASWNERL
jgi:lipoate-protein ligase A